MISSFFFNENMKTNKKLNSFEKKSNIKKGNVFLPEQDFNCSESRKIKLIVLLFRLFIVFLIISFLFCN